LARKCRKRWKRRNCDRHGAAKPRVPWLKETLGTKDQKEAKVRAKPVMMKFDRVGGPSYAALRAFSEKLLVSGGAL
jgi:hypothetical protein